MAHRDGGRRVHVRIDVHLTGHGVMLRMLDPPVYINFRLAYVP